MKVEMREVVILTTEETRMVAETRALMLDILEQVNDPDIYNAVQQVCDGLGDFEVLVMAD